MDNLVQVFVNKSNEDRGWWDSVDIECSSFKIENEMLVLKDKYDSMVSIFNKGAWLYAKIKKAE